MGKIRLSILILILLAFARVSAAIDVTPGFSGSWYDPNHNGEGYVLQVISNQKALVYWFTYDSEGSQAWVTGVGEISGSSITFADLQAPVGGRFGPKFDPTDVEHPAWGTLVLDFSDCASGTAAYSGPPEFSSGTLNIQRLSSLWGVDCNGQTNINPTMPNHFLNPGFSGTWFDQKHNGEGFTVDIVNESTALIYWFTYDTLGNQAWMFGAGEIDGSTVLTTNMMRPTGGQFGAGFDPTEIVLNDWGPTVFTFGSCDRAAMRYVPPDNFGIESTQTLKRLASISGVDCELLTDTHTITGSISVAENTFIDADINDPEWPEVSNDLEGGTAQQLVPPAIVVGYVTEQPTGVSGDRFESESDPWDIYLVPLKSGEGVELIISDWLENDPEIVDLDLYLMDSQNIDIGEIDLHDLVDSSLSTNPVERVGAPRDGIYYIAVEALSGASNYLLKTGQSASAQTEKLTVAVPMVEGEIIASINYKNSLKSSVQDQTITQRMSSLEKQFGLERLSSGEDGSVHYRLKTQRMDRMTPHPLTRHSLASISPVDWNVVRLVKQLQNNPDYQWVGPNYRVQTQLIPNDPIYKRQWHYPAIRLPQAWDVTTGDSSVVVAVLDSGVFPHTELTANVDYSIGYDFVTDPFGAADGDGIDPDATDPGEVFPPLEPYTSHGTHVAGTVGATSNNGSGVAGVTWDVTVMPVRVIGIDEGDCHDINNGLKWAGRLPNDSKTLPDRPADIINMSFRSLSPCPGAQSIISQLVAQGTIVIAAAGNDGSSLPVYPAAFADVFSVSATGLTDYLAPYSNTGPSVDLAAPGGDITRDANQDGYPDGVWSTGMQVDEGTWLPYQTIHNFQGTSMAAPHVAGVAALMKSADPQFGPGEFDAALASGEIAIDLGKAGKDQQFGYGRIDALSAVRWAQANAGSGQESAIITSSLSALDFGASGQSFDLEITKAGPGALSIVSRESTEPWIDLSAVTLDANNFGTYKVTVNRTGLQEGSYAGFVSFQASDGSSLSIPVAMRVGESLAGSAGYLYALLLDEWTLQNIKQWDGLPVNGQYALHLQNVTPGSYFLVVGTDVDNDQSICDPGEFCQFYPSTGDLSPIEITDHNVNIPVFVLAPPVPNNLNTNTQAESANETDQDSGKTTHEVLNLLLQGLRRP